MKIRIEWIDSRYRRCRVTLIPGWFRRLFGGEIRQGIACRGTYTVTSEDEYDDDGYNVVTKHVGFFWASTDRHVGWQVMRAIEAAPLVSPEDMSVEQLLLSGVDDHR